MGTIPGWIVDHTLITGSIPGMSRKLLVKAAAAVPLG